MTCLLMMDAAVGRWSPVDFVGARSAMKAKERKCSQVSALRSRIAPSMILVKESATDARAAFGILFITGQPLRSIARRSARAGVAEQAAVLLIY